MEHKQLKEICDLIGFEYLFCRYNKIEGFEKWDNHLQGYVKVDVREIIFTQEFIDKYMQYLFKETKYEYGRNEFNLGLLSNLDKPVLYLYNLIK